MSTISLCLVTKNDAPSVLRCLNSVAPLVDHVFVEDLGSNDGTQTAIRRWLLQNRMPGHVDAAPDGGFEQNRTHVLARLRENEAIDFALLIEADDQVVLENGFDAAAFKQSLAEDVYTIGVRDGSDEYRGNLLCSNKQEFSYREAPYPTLVSASGQVTPRDAVGLHVLKESRTPAEADPAVYQRDAQVLGQILQIDFFGRSYERANAVGAAADCFVQRALLGHWGDELFLSLYRAAQLEEAMGAQSLDALIAGYLRASIAVPTRAEGLYAAARLCRLHGKYADGYEFAKRGLEIPPPQDGLFVERWVYDYGLLDEYATCATQIGKAQESLEVCRRLLREGKLPTTKRQSVRANFELAMRHLGAQGALPAPSVPPTPEPPRVVRPVPAGNPPKLALVCGPWGSGSSAVAGLLLDLGVMGIGPHYPTYDPKTPNSYESIPFKNIIEQNVHGPTLTPKPGAHDAVRSGLLDLRQRIEAQEFGPYDANAPGYVVLKNQASVLFLSQLCEVFDTKLIYVMRPLKDIELTRLRRLWPPLTGAIGATIIYRHMSDALSRYSDRILMLNYGALLESPASRIQDIVRFLGIDPGQQALDQGAEFIASRGTRGAPAIAA